MIVDNQSLREGKTALPSVEATREQLCSRARPVTECEEVELLAATGRVLAADQRAVADLPSADQSAMDGYALRQADLDLDRAAPPWIRVTQRIAAGETPQALEPGSAARIFTGGSLPPGADTVIMQEAVEEGEAGLIRLRRTPQPGDHVRRKAHLLAAGKVVMSAGGTIRVQDIGLLAAAGHAVVPVYRRLRVAVVTSGSELLEPGTPPQPNRVYNSNLPQIRALLRTTPCDVVASVQIGDTLSETVAVLRGLQGRADVILTTAGVSVGEEDHIRPAIEQLGRIEQWRVNLKPGKPFVFGQIGTTPLLGLPGNPVSAFVVFLLFVRPFLLTTAGGRAPTLPTWSACADFEIQQTGARREYRRALIAPREDGLWLTLYPDQDSANLASISGSDALVLLPPKSAIARGDRVWFHPLSGLLHG